MKRVSLGRTLAGAGVLFAWSVCASGADVTSVKVTNTSSSAVSNVPVTFGQVFEPGDVPAGAVIGGRLGSANLALQVDKKATHRDGSLRHALITAIVPSLAGGATQTLTLTNSGSAPGGAAITTGALLGTTFDATVNLSIGGTAYTASARSLLQSGTPTTWLSGPLTTEWVLSAPVRTSSGTAHPHLQARFYVRAYQGLQSVRVDVVVENTWAREAGPRNYGYNAAITVAGRGTVFSESAVTHYRQSRWRRTAWWGTTPAADVTHDGDYLARARAVPNYDPRIQINSGQLNTFVSEFNANAKLMGIGNLNPYMPSPSGFNAIGPLPAWAAAYLVSGDLRAKNVVVGYGTQAGAWPMHYREKSTDQPISIDTYPNASVLGGGFFPACGGDCSSPYTPEASHHPSLAFLPYLLTGDYYLMEETAFWGNWVLFYGESSRHGGSQGLVTWDQVRGQAWSLRTLAQAAYLLPDNHPLKSYFNAKLQNNINYFITNWVNSNPLGYITNTGAAQWLGLDTWISTWMDDFLTWTFGYILGMGYTEAQPVFNWKSKFPIGRMTHPDMCSILAPSYWPYVRNDRYLGGSGAFITTWADWKRGVILSHSNDAFRGTADISGREQELINAACGSQQMASILGLGAGQMIGWFDHLSYLANMQPALAVAVDHGMPNAQAAFDKVRNSPNYALSDYGYFPQFALWPLGASASVPAVSISASPATLQTGQNSTLTWSATNATSCSASGGWSGNKAVSGSQSVGPLSTSTDFTLTCTGASGSASATAHVTVQSTPAPTLTFTANPTSVPSGTNTLLRWSTTHATSCTASGSWNGSRPVSSGGYSIGPITVNRSFTLTCAGAGGSVQRSVSVTVQGGAPPPAPTLTFTANPTSVPSGTNTLLRWSTTHATSCTASGSWNGSRPVSSGGYSIGPITVNRTFTLTCTGAGGSVQRSVSVTVQGGGSPPAPTLTFTANPTSVPSGTNTLLRWSTTNATSCTASGTWSGPRPVSSGGYSIGPITVNRTFTLTCTGAGGSVSRSVTVTVSGGGGNASLSGAVDSSYVDRFGTNKVYVFAGSVTPDDIDGDAVEPVATLAVNQNGGTCTFGYAGGTLAAGTYTIAFTQDAGADVPGQSNTLAFVGTRQVTVGGSAVTSNFRPGGILTVGPGKQFATLRAAQLAATAGAVIEIDAGTYTDDVTVWRQNNVTLRGVGGRAHIRGNRRIPFISGDDRNNGMGLMVIRGSGISVENFEFSGAQVDDLNGAGIRNQGSNLSVCNGYFHDNEDGYLGGAYGTLLFEYSEFANNGFGDFGRNHNVYVDDGERLIFRHNYSHHAQVGHTLKTRAQENHILYNRIMDEASGNSSYTIDVPEGGLTFVIGNLLQQGPNTENAAILNYGTEGLASGRTHQLYLVNNSFVNDRGSGSFLQFQNGTSLVRTINNLFVGGGTVPGGGVVQATTNLTTNAPGFVNEGTYDYRLTATAPAIDAGTAPGSAASVALTPSYQYIHKANRQSRPGDSRIDIGAYEYVP